MRGQDPRDLARRLRLGDIADVHGLDHRGAAAGEGVLGVLDGRPELLQEGAAAVRRQPRAHPVGAHAEGRGGVADRGARLQPRAAAPGVDQPLVQREAVRLGAREAQQLHQPVEQVAEGRVVVDADATLAPGLPVLHAEGDLTLLLALPGHARGVGALVGEDHLEVELAALERLAADRHPQPGARGLLPRLAVEGVPAEEQQVAPGEAADLRGEVRLAQRARVEPHGEAEAEVLALAAHALMLLAREPELQVVRLPLLIKYTL